MFMPRFASSTANPTCRSASSEQPFGSSAQVPIEEFDSNRFNHF